MNRIILIGNGFDLAHNLQTRYDHFLNWYWEQKVHEFIYTHGDKLDDSLCSLTLKNNRYMRSWSCFYHTEIKRLSDPIPAKDVINSITKNPNTFGYMPSILFRRINEVLKNRGWVDIENEFYSLLCSTAYDNPKKLNDELDYIKARLIDYLKGVEESFDKTHMLNKKLQAQMFAGIRPCEIAVASKYYLTEFIERRRDYSELDWGNFLRIYNKENLSTRGFMSHIKDDCYDGNMPSDFELRFGKTIPEEFLVPDRIMLLNFNYTSIADAYLPNESIFSTCHIHGSIENPNSVIFGYGDELDSNYQNLLRKNDNEFLRNMKTPHYLESNNYRNMLEFIEYAPYQVYIMGHSCGNSDRTLLNTLFEHRNCVSIKPFYYQYEKDGVIMDNYLDIVQNITRNFKDMKLMRDRVVNKTLCEPLAQVVSETTDLIIKG